MFQVDINIPSQTLKQEEDETDYYPQDEADENTLEHRSNTSDEKTSGHKLHKHPTATENDVHQMTEHSGTGHQKTTLKEQMSFVILVGTGSLPPQAMNSVGTFTTNSLQFVQENNRENQQIKAISLEERPPPTHLNFESQFFQKLIQKETYGSCQKDIGRKYLAESALTTPVKIITSKQ